MGEYRDKPNRGFDRNDRRDRDERGARASRPPQKDRYIPPFIPEGVEYSELDREVRARLRGLSKENAERVGKHLVMAGELLESDPELAYEHAQAAVRRAGRIDVVREAAALTAYATGKYAEALREFRTVRRLSGIDLHRAAEADCERGLGRPERALEVIAEAPQNLSQIQRAELAIVEAGARRDLKQPEVALIILEDAPRTKSTYLRLDEARADVLMELGRTQDAQRILDSLPAEEEEDEDSFLDYEDLDARADYDWPESLKNREFRPQRDDRGPRDGRRPSSDRGYRDDRGRRDEYRSRDDSRSQGGRPQRSGGGPRGPRKPRDGDHRNG